MIAMAVHDSNKFRKAVIKEIATHFKCKLGNQGNQAYTPHDKTTRLSMGHALQEVNYHQRSIQVKSLPESPWRTTGPRNTLLGHVCTRSHLVCNKVNVILSAIA